MRRAVIALACIAGVVGVSAQQKTVVLHNLNAYDILYVLAGGGENAVALMRDDGIVLIDPLPFGWGTASMEAIETVSDQPVTTIVNIRASEDHLKANTEYPKATKIIAHRNLLERAKKMPVFAGANAKFAPNVAVTDRLSFLDGPDKMDLYFFGPGRTDSDLVVAFAAKGTAYLGDLYPSKSAPVIEPARGGSGLKFLQTLTKVRSDLQGVRRVIAGHDPPTPGEVGTQRPGAVMPMTSTPSWKDFEEYADFVSAFVTAVQDAKKAGKTAEQAAGLMLPDRFKAYDMRGAAVAAAVIYGE